MNARKMVHIGMVVFALFIGRLPPWAITCCAAAAFLFNVFLLKRVGGSALEKPEERASGIATGLLWYPASVLLLSLIFFSAQVFVAVGWGAMAFGDAAASLAGQAWKGPALPWNRSKSWLGMLFFLLIGVPATLALVFCLPDSAWIRVGDGFWQAVIAGVFLAGWAETLPVHMDDNLLVPVSASVGAWAWIQLFY